MTADTSHRRPASRGRLRIYLGCAPGAGTTCALLGEGRWRAEHGTDVVVASAETRGRAGTEALLAGLEIVSAPAAAYRGAAVEGIDLGAILARRPQVALVDDLAHSNAPGARHAARWQDVKDLVAAGIEVISTALLAFARAENATRLMIGAARRTRRLSLPPWPGTTQRVIRGHGGIALHIVSRTSTANGVLPAAGETSQRRTSQQRRQRWTRTPPGPAAHRRQPAGAADGQPAMRAGIQSGWARSRRPP